MEVDAFTGYGPLTKGDDEGSVVGESGHYRQSVIRDCTEAL